MTSSRSFTRLPVKPKPLDFALDPFRYVAGGLALGLGAACILLESLAAWHFGVGMASLQHRYYFQLPFHGHVLVAIGNWLWLFAFLLIAGRIFSRSRFRVVDLAGTLALSRLPAVVSTFLLAPGSVTEIAGTITRDPHSLSLAGGRLVWLTVTLLTILMMLYSHWLAWRAFAISCNVKGALPVAGFIIAVLLASIASFLLNGWYIEGRLPE